VGLTPKTWDTRPEPIREFTKVALRRGHPSPGHIRPNANFRGANASHDVKWEEVLHWPLKACFSFIDGRK
jgi:hypothetical protein